MSPSARERESAAFRQKLTYARPFLWLPYSTVGMVARIRGAVNLPQLNDALRRVRALHPALGTRIEGGEDGTVFLTGEDVPAFPVEVLPGRGPDDRVRGLVRAHEAPFDLDGGPMARVYLFPDDDGFELAILAHHAVCDGLSVGALLCDLIALLNAPDWEPEPVRSPIPVSRATLPPAAGCNRHLRLAIAALNLVWRASRERATSADYRRAFAEYWRQPYGLVQEALDAETASALLARCKRENVSLTAALATAHLRVRDEVVGPPPHDRYRVGVPMDLRGRMHPHPGRTCGLYATSVVATLLRRQGPDFWASCRHHQRAIRRCAEDPRQFYKPLLLADVDPRAVDALSVRVFSGKPVGLLAPLLAHVEVARGSRVVDISNMGRVVPHGQRGPYALECIWGIPPANATSALHVDAIGVGGLLTLSAGFRTEDVATETAHAIMERAQGVLTRAAIE